MLGKFNTTENLPVLYEADVAVIGAGPGGLGAAIMSSKCGAKTVLIEAYGLPGGMAVIGEVQPFMISGTREKPLDSPIYTQWKEAMLNYFPKADQTKYQKATDYSNRAINKAVAACAAEDLLLENKVEILYHHQLVGVNKENDKIKEIICFTNGGFGVIKAKVFVDSTGDGNLAALADCPFEMGDENGGCQPMTLCFKLSHVKVPYIQCEHNERFIDPEWKNTINKYYEKAKEEGIISCPRENVLLFPFQIADEGVVHFNTTRVQGFDPTDGRSFSKAEIEGRRQLKELVKFFQERVPGFENSRLMSMAVQIGVRESRRIKGDYYLQVDDFLNCSRFDDVIARSTYNIDIHSPLGGGTTLKNIKPGDYYEIPYRATVPLNCQNLTIGSRCISSDVAVHSSLRIMPTVISIGQGAGVGAALAALNNISTHEVNGLDVRNKLIDLGANLK